MNPEVLIGLKHESMKEKVRWFSRFSPSRRYEIIAGFAQFILAARGKKGNSHAFKRTRKIIQGVK
ncbi:hypothetical protein COY52_12820 [Candidatus Desantisbacteria bacterium CG_4_10_14_0_8_um_filter_48_22]|uniref:Uncharacterized protein n=1 Tax=Candidatus Desantisbacteria bacterium CG_4_10_14_0_8_um_filter_48_22 TaxID=1974543 RepID=A0A2M7S4Z5_9BACT|nr:MAG: hypothetical protein AUJ67_09420 [Candidatus Desantisbacteria bacterium CG1_02_49_89]PIV54173.1 MAG: hypothetical protein COS16_11675 [Candidatus Desantisbacteria bacterium CG02_land_8_20_14_3_00_49_13]PIZ14398.1 MAG: hypothetical protein COY52_12820 [Candidatus Desantisbacteria bacterium CG_4_10_14_0_8_um_filter_48_22]PJB27273.1 MAG: hypothetical protein CO111_06220 [Candidatus Desantisbacteria bacterium CG_4_9_14_3_um_filter_50_7]